MVLSPYPEKDVIGEITKQVVIVNDEPVYALEYIRQLHKVISRMRDEVIDLDNELVFIVNHYRFKQNSGLL